MALSVISELADIVRRRACPSVSEELLVTVRRKVTVPILPPPKYTETTLKATTRLRGRGQACNPSSSKVPAVIADEAAGPGRWRACLPTSQSDHTTNQRSTKQIQVALDMHIERLVEGVFPMRLTSILTRAMKSKISQSVGTRWPQRRRYQCECASMLVTQPDTSTQPLGLQLILTEGAT